MEELCNWDMNRDIGFLTVYVDAFHVNTEQLPGSRLAHPSRRRPCCLQTSPIPLHAVPPRRHPRHRAPGAIAARDERRHHGGQPELYGKRGKTHAGASPRLGRSVIWTDGPSEGIERPPKADPASRMFALVAMTVGASIVIRLRLISSG